MLNKLYKLHIPGVVQVNKGLRAAGGNAILLRVHILPPAMAVPALQQWTLGAKEGIRAVVAIFAVGTGQHSRLREKCNRNF